METETMRNRTCCFSGHRMIPPSEMRRITQRTENAVRCLIIQRQVCYFGVGGAIGYDTLAAKVLFSLRKTEFSQIKVILVYPFDGYTERWTEEQKKEYKKLLPEYDKVVRVCSRPGKKAYFLRNRHLVDGSAYCIAYCTNSYGGTAYTVRYAEERGLHVWNVADR